MPNTTKLFTRLLPDGSKAQAPSAQVLNRVCDALWAQAKSTKRRARYWAHAVGARFDPIISGRPDTKSKRVYNEIYCHPNYAMLVELAILSLKQEHPEWELDLATGPGNWEDAED